MKVRHSWSGRSARCLLSYTDRVGQTDFSLFPICKYTLFWLKDFNFPSMESPSSPCSFNHGHIKDSSFSCTSFYSEAHVKLLLLVESQVRTREWQPGDITSMLASATIVNFIIETRSHWAPPGWCVWFWQALQAHKTCCCVCKMTSLGHGIVS